MSRFVTAIRGLEALRGTRAARETMLGVAFVALITGLHVLNAIAIEGELLNFSGDWNVPTFAAGLLFVVAGLSCARTARHAHGPERTGWTLVGLIVGLLGVEAVVNLHGKLEEVGDLRIAVLIAIPVLGALAVLLLARPLSALRPPAPLLLIAGAALLVATQALAAFTGSTDIAGAPRRLFSIFQEGGEMLSACFVLAAAAAALEPLRADGRPGEAH